MDTPYRARQVSARLASLLVWREGARLPPLHVLGANITDLQLTHLPSVQRRSLGAHTNILTYKYTHVDKELRVVHNLLCNLRLTAGGYKEMSSILADQ